jgi:hypothetical protein
MHHLRGVQHERDADQPDVRGHETPEPDLPEPELPEPRLPEPKFPEPNVTE